MTYIKVDCRTRITGTTKSILDMVITNLPEIVKLETVLPAIGNFDHAMSSVFLEIVKYPGSDENFEGLKDVNITCSASGFGHILIGDVEGNIHLINRQLTLSTFHAYELRVTHLYQSKQQPVLVSVGNDKNGNPMCTRIIRAIPSNNPTSVNYRNNDMFDSVEVLLLRLAKKVVTCLAVQDTLNNMAVGFEDGSVILYKGDVTRDRHSKQKVLNPGSSCINGLSFRCFGRSQTLFVVTLDCVMSYNLAVKDWESKLVLDDQGCRTKCAIMADSKEDNQLVIGRKDALYFYQPDDRGQCLAFEGEKIILHWFRGYLVVVSKENKSVSAVHVGCTVMCICAPYVLFTKLIEYAVILVDIKEPLAFTFPIGAAYSAPMPEVADVVSEWGSLYVIGIDRKLYNLQEKDTQSKLDVLFRKNLYTLAISVAKSRQYDEEGLIDIFRQYGDHLYMKGDHDGAINQYIKTIGKLEPSYVIRKFLDAQRIHNLTAYLQALHKKSLANEDHTTLLLNCYTKLKDHSKLDEFIMTKDREVDFDVEIAIKVCRQAGFYTHALYLAERHQQHEWYLKIQLEDHQDYMCALSYISKLDFYEEPEKTTELLKSLCTDYKPSNRAEPELPKRAQAEDFIHIFVNNSKKLTDFLEHMVKVHSDCKSYAYNTLLELYLLNYKTSLDVTEKEIQEKKIMNLLKNSEAECDIDQALVLCQMNFFKPGVLLLYEKAKFEQNSNLWVEALTRFAKTEDDTKKYLCKYIEDLFVITMTISDSDNSDVEYEPMESDNETIDSYESDDVLSEHEDDSVMLSDSWKRIADIFSDCRPNSLPELVRNFSGINPALNCNANNSILENFKKFITNDVINYLVKNDSKKNRNARSAGATQVVLKGLSKKLIFLNSFLNIEKKKLLSPLMVIETLSNSNTVTLAAVKEYMIRHLNEENDQITEDERMIQQYRDETIKIRQQNHDIKTRCFESYSAECDTECPLCLPENRKVLDIIRAQEQVRDLHEQFHHQLERAEDSFSVVADYFGRGVFNKVTLITDTPTRKPSSLSSSQPTNPFTNNPY
ncbi:Vacuolar protein sorting-associated protein 11 [Nymphon striatum]|nr:Vacuolar protein sorting-associated protein 11 [Nymphon striatum]